ncbi:UPF0061-domain-containing protein [Meredithblackwellia eburnea MCA 4105]
MTSTTTKKTSILALPISPAAPPYHLPPDPLFPTPASLLSLSHYEPPEELKSNQGGPITLREGDPTPPSMLRRARIIRNGGAFTYTSPLPLEFPYDFQDKDQQEHQVKETGKEVMAKAETIEESLAAYEPDPQFPVTLDAHKIGPVTAFSSKRRQRNDYPKPQLISHSQRLLDEWLPQLDFGQPGSQESDVLIDVLGGKTVLAREPKEGSEDHVEKLGFAPWSLCYGGHQFGSWAGQLGDGRAISIFSTSTTPEVETATEFKTMELQLKGAGRTPYSRFADGLAVLRSSIREYLGAEAVAALNLPTSRALALVNLPEVNVLRERLETAAVVTRIAPSWIRIGNFEIQATRSEYETLRLLTSYVATQVLHLPPPASPSTHSSSQALAVLREVAKRNAVMIAGWQAYGFCHGVMNTDNISVMGLCIDFGPFAFLDVYDASHICNHSDSEGRYSYRNQPSMGVYAVQKLGIAISRMIGCEESLPAPTEGFRKVEAGWATAALEGLEDKAKDARLEEWRKVGMDKTEEVKTEFQKVFKEEYERLMRLRLGFKTSDSGDFTLLSDFLDLLETHSLDYSSSFRLLSQFTSTKSKSYSSFLSTLFPPSSHTSSTTTNADFTRWFDNYEARLKHDGEDEGSRRQRMDKVNPRFVLRQWVLEETIGKSQQGDHDQLNLVLEMSQNPFKSYGEKEIGEGEAEEKQECRVVGEEERLCGLGDKDMLGFQCSCSS